MLSALRARLTYANVMATVAVFLALGGGAVAATKIGSAQIVNNSVTGADLRNNSVTGGDLRNGSVGGIDVRDAGLTGADVRDGSLGPADLAAGVIPAAPATTPRATVTVRVGSPATAGANGVGPGCVDGVPGGSKGYRDAAGALVPAGGCGGGAGGSGNATAQCQAGELATGGGYQYAEGKRHALVTENHPVPATAGGTPTAWRIRVQTLTNDSTNDSPVTPFVVCMRP